MTDMQKQAIKAMREEGKSYIKIATSLNISENTVKSYCKRNNLGGRLKSNTASNDDSPSYCKQCNKPLVQKQGTKTRKFCSPSCRSLWWAAHPEKMNQKAVYHFKCAYCGSHFSAYGNKGRKYCSHDCYVASRFRKEAAL